MSLKINLIRPKWYSIVGRKMWVVFFVVAFQQQQDWILKYLNSRFPQAGIIPGPPALRGELPEPFRPEVRK